MGMRVRHSYGPLRHQMVTRRSYVEHTSGTYMPVGYPNAYRELFFRKVAYTRHDVTLFVERTDYGKLNITEQMQHILATAETETCAVVNCSYNHCHLHADASLEPIITHLSYHIRRICVSDSSNNTFVTMTE
jgi:hypothetical protein